MRGGQPAARELEIVFERGAARKGFLRPATSLCGPHRFYNILGISMSLREAKKRKITEEKRKFNPEWTERFFFVDRRGKCVCFICDESGCFKGV